MSTETITQKEKQIISLKKLSRWEQRFLGKVEAYVLSCKENPKSKVVANLCGLCRFLGIGRGELMAVLTSSEALSDRVLTLLEDEAISSDVSSVMISHYIRLIEESRRELRSSGNTTSAWTVIFGHGDGE